MIFYKRIYKWYRKVFYNETTVTGVFLKSDIVTLNGNIYTKECLEKIIKEHKQNKYSAMKFVNLNNKGE